MWGQLIIALACALEILAQDCEDPTRAVYLNLTSKMYDVNGTQYNATKFEDQATVTCAIGYRLIGKHDNALINETIKCTDTGKWSQIAGCETKDCEDPTSAVFLNLTSKMYDINGTQYNATKFEDQATVTCASGYRLIGKHDNALVNETINCTDTGKWSQIAGCEKKDCVIPSGPRFNRSSYLLYKERPASEKTHYYAGERIIVGEWIQVVCNKDRQGDGVLIVSNHECTAEKWKPRLPNCRAVCSPECQNGGTCVSPGKCRCRDGFDGLHCENDIDECSTSDLNDCHHFSNCTNTPGNYTCKCVDGYIELDDNRGRRCEEILQYKSCGAPPKVENALASERITTNKTFPHQTVVSYTCKAGFDKRGTTSNFTCVDGEWTLADIICATTTTVKTTTTLTTTTPIRTTSPIKITTSTTTGIPTTTTIPITTTSPETTTTSTKITTPALTSTQTTTTTPRPTTATTAAATATHMATSEKKENTEITTQKTVCSPKCQNGGTCVLPGKCYCRDGFDGLHCENDIDECSISDLNNCHRFSICTNTPGNYTCKCIDGYVDLDDNRGRRCEALCNPECQNGGTCVSPYKCQCPDGFHGPICENETKKCTLEAGQNVNYWHMSTNTKLSEGEKVTNGTQIRVTCQNTGFDYSDYYSNDVSTAYIDCLDGVFKKHELKCELDTKLPPESSPIPKKCTTIENGQITDRGKSFTCNPDYKPSFKNGMDAILYARYSCKCSQTTGRLQCMGTEVECKPIGCMIPANVQQGMTLYDPKERRTISAANRYEIQHGQFLIFTCEPSDVFYFEPNRRMFECVKGSWAARQRRGEDKWDFGNDGSFPECRKVICPADYCKFGGHCIRDQECQCPEQTSGKQCETPLCSSECQNEGQCVLPDTCQCPYGFDGLRCENALLRPWAPANGFTSTHALIKNEETYTIFCNEGFVLYDVSRPDILRDCVFSMEVKNVLGDFLYNGKDPVKNLTCVEVRKCSAEKYLVKNGSTLSVSSQWDQNEPYKFGADQGRLNSTETAEGTSFRAGVWAAGVADTNQYIQVKFTAPKLITGIATRGRPKSQNQDIPQWVKEYRFMYSTDCETFNTYTHWNGSDMLFDANVDGNTIQPNKLPCPVRALCARVNPTKWEGHISMQFDVKGCDGPIKK